MTAWALFISLFIAPAASDALAQEEISRLKPGDHIWVGYGMAKGYDLPFAKRLTVKKLRYMFMAEVRVVFEEYPRRFYLRADFGPDYAFRGEPFKTFDFTEEQWEDIKQGVITVGMSKTMFLCIKPKSKEIHYQTSPDGPLEQWLYREHPTELFGSAKQNPPTGVYYFQDDILVRIL